MCSFKNCFNFKQKCKIS